MQKSFLFPGCGARRWRGAGFILSVKWLCAPRGAERSFIKADCSLLMSKENQKTTSDFDALDPRERGCSPLSDPEKNDSKWKKMLAAIR